MAKALLIWQRSAPTAALALLLCLAFVFGGSSWPSEPGLGALRALALVLAGLGTLTLGREAVILFRPLWALFGACMLLTLLHLLRLPFDLWSRLPDREVIAAADAIAGLGQISRPLSLSPNATLNALLSLSVPGAVLVLATQLDRRGRGHILALVMILLCLSAACTLLQAAGAPLALYDDADRYAGLFANRNHQGVALALLFPVAATLYPVGAHPSPQTWGLRLLLIAAMLLTVPVIVLTGSRSGLALSLLALLVLPLLLRNEADAGPDRRRLHAVWIAMIAVAGLIAGGMAYTSRDAASARLALLGDDLRWPLWESVATAVPRHLPWGTGIGSFRDSYQIDEPDAMLRPSLSNHAHNDWLELLYTAGIPGALLAVVGLALLLIAGRNMFRLRGDPRRYAILGVTIATMLAMASFTDYPLRTPVLAALFALAAVWAWSGNGLARPLLHDA